MSTLPPSLTVRIPWNQCDQNLNENCAALLSIKVSAIIWLASVNSWRRSSSFTKCNMGQMDSDQRKQKSTMMNPPPPKKELHHVEWVWTKIYSKTVCSLTVHSKCINDHTLRSDIFLPKCPTNLRVDYLVGHFGLGRTFWSDVRVDIKRFFFTFLEVKISNILWSMRICKRTFFPVCRMCGYVNTLVYFYLAPYSRQER